MEELSTQPIADNELREDVDNPKRPPLTDYEKRYMQGDNEPVTSSVLISNSKYLNDPYYRDAFAQHSLRRHGHDLPPTYTIPTMVRAITETTDYAEAVRLIAEAKAANPEFAEWLDARRLTLYTPEQVAGYAEGTLGAAIRDFLAQGYDMQFMNKEEVVTDIGYMTKRRAQLHDMEHIVTGYGPNSAGEMALSIANVTSAANYFPPELAQFMSAPNVWVTASSYKRISLHYPAALPITLEAMQKGIELGNALKKPLFMYHWEDYLGWTLEALAEEIGIVRGPGDAWAWTTGATTG